MARKGLPFTYSLRGLLAFMCPLLAPIAAHAQEPLAAVVFRTASAAADMDIAAAVDPLVLTELNERNDLHVVERPALDLQATQIAIDCVGETPACLSAVLSQYAEASVLIAPSIQRADEETVVTFLYFDPRGTGEFRTVVGRYRGEDVAQQALDAVPSMLRALLNPSAKQPVAPAPAVMPDAVRAPESELPAPSHATRVAADAEVRAFPCIPVGLLFSSVVIGGMGVAFGLASEGSERDYHDAAAGNNAEVDAAIELRENAHREAWVANVSYGVAAAAFVLGATLLAVHLTSDSEPEKAALSASASIAPAFGPHDVGLALSGTMPRTW